MKKIVMSSNTSWYTFNFRANLGLTLQKKGYEVIVIAPKDDYSEKLIEMGFKYYDIEINNKGTNPIEEALLIYRYFKLYKKIKPDIVLHNTIKPDIYATLVAGILKIPAICSVSGLGSLFIHSSIALKIAKLLYKISFTIPKKVYFENIEDMNAFIYHKLISKDKAYLVPGTGIDLQKFKAKPKSKKAEKSPFIFLIVSRLVKDKGILEYVEAAKILRIDYPNTKFQILGPLYEENPSAITSKELQEWIDQDIITYLGQTDNVVDILADIDCMVLPSYREGMSRTLLEAASMGKPLITTNVPGCKEIVDHGVNGYLCRVADVKDLTDKMRDMLELDTKTIASMGKKSREKMVKVFDENIVINQYVDAIESILSHE